MSEGNKNSPLFKAALEGSAQALLSKAGFENKNKELDMLSKSVPHALEMLLEPILDNGSRGEETAMHLLSMLMKTPETPNSHLQRYSKSESLEAIPQFSLILLELLKAFFNPDDAHDKKAIEELNIIFKELNVEILGIQKFSLSLKNPIPDPIQKKIEEQIKKRFGRMRDILKRLNTLLGRIKAERLKTALMMLENEFEDPKQFFERLAIGFVFSGAGLIADPVVEIFGKSRKEMPSNKKLGNEVHEILQERYRGRLSTPTSIITAPVNKKYIKDYILQDNQVYWSQKNSEELSRLAWKESDGTLIALVFARYDEYFFRKFVGEGFIHKNIYSMYREDTLDLLKSVVYEIKPVRSAFFGVIQELQYRHSFNMAHAAMMDLFESIGNKKFLLKLLPKIKYFSSSNPYVFSGDGMLWSGYLTPFSVEDKNGRYVAVPFSVTLLPGLLLYILLKSPALERLILLAPPLAEKFRDRIENEANKLAKAVQTVYYGLLATLAAGVFVILFVALGEFLIPLIGIEGVLIGGAEVLRRLISLVPMPALTHLGLAPSPGTRGASAINQTNYAQAVVDSLHEVATKLDLLVEVQPQFVGDKLFIKFKETNRNDRPESTERDETIYVDLTFSNIVISSFPVKGISLLEYLLNLSNAIASYALIQSIFDSDMKSASQV